MSQIDMMAKSTTSSIPAIQGNARKTAQLILLVPAGAAALAFVIIFALKLIMMPPWEVSVKRTSPDGKIVALLETRNQGATGGSTRLILRGQHDEVTVISVSHVATDANLDWQSPSILRVDGILQEWLGASERREKLAASVDGVSVEIDLF